VLTVLIVPLQNELVTVAAAVAWGMALFALGSDALDAEELEVVRALTVSGVGLTLVFAALAGLLGFLVSTVALGLSAACVWQRQRLIAV